MRGNSEEKLTGRIASDYKLHVRFKELCAADEGSFMEPIKRIKDNTFHSLQVLELSQRFWQAAVQIVSKPSALIMLLFLGASRQYGPAE